MMKLRAIIPVLVLLLSPDAGSQSGNVVPYAPNSPWNLKIGSDPVYETNGDILIETMEGYFGADPTQYTLPLYEVDSTTPVQAVAVENVFSKVSDGGSSLEIQLEVTVQVPIPEGAEPAAGTDAQIVIWNPSTGDEWGFWRIEQGSGGWQAVNGYYYNTQWSGVPPPRFGSRGAGLPYFAGLVRPWEIAQGRIEHAIAFGVNDPSSLYVYPATKSDGDVVYPGIPLGARLQLDPSLTEEDFEEWGLDSTGRIVARALQEYGMIAVDSSGHPKIYVEYEGTADWTDTLDRNTVRNIPYSAFRVLALDTPTQPGEITGVSAEASAGCIAIQWEDDPWATRYLVLKRAVSGSAAPILGMYWVDSNQFKDTGLTTGQTYEYSVAGSNHNGMGTWSAPVNLEAVGE